MFLILPEVLHGHPQCLGFCVFPTVPGSPSVKMGMMLRVIQSRALFSHTKDPHPGRESFWPALRQPRMSELRYLGRAGWGVHTSIVPQNPAGTSHLKIACGAPPWLD